MNKYVVLFYFSTAFIAVHCNTRVLVVTKRGKFLKDLHVVARIAFIPGILINVWVVVVLFKIRISAFYQLIIFQDGSRVVLYPNILENLLSTLIANE